MSQEICPLFSPRFTTVMGEQGGVLSPEDVLYICGTPAAFDRYYEEFPT